VRSGSFCDGVYRPLAYRPIFSDEGRPAAKKTKHVPARGRKLGRQTGQRPKSDRLAATVIAAVAEGRSYRWIARDLGLSKNTVLDVVKRNRPPKSLG
jgi:DNA invertase Pin-like site-specific DNA recombinase